MKTFGRLFLAAIVAGTAVSGCASSTPRERAEAFHRTVSSTRGCTLYRDILTDPDTCWLRCNAKEPRTVVYVMTSCPADTRGYRP